MSASSKIDKKIADLGDWRGDRLAEIRKLIHEAAPEVVEEWKWMGSPVWSHNGILAVASAPRNKVKLTFVYGAKLPDPKGLFNATLDGNKRAIELHRGGKVDSAAFKALVRQAAAYNAENADKGPILLSGGNPQIPKGDGDSPVQAYIAAMEGWKSDLGRSLDDLIVNTVPNVRKAVRWNSPFYGIEGKGWFVSYHVFARYVKVTFLNGASLCPVPPGSGKDKDSRWIDIYEGELNEEQMATWIRHAAALPGWSGF